MLELNLLPSDDEPNIFPLSHDDLMITLPCITLEVLECQDKSEKEFWPQQDLNLLPSDAEFDTFPLSHADLLNH